MKKLLCIVITFVLLAGLIPATTIFSQAADNIIDVGDSSIPSGTGWTFSDEVFTVTGEVS